MSYLEIFLLLQIFFWYFAVLRLLPPPENSLIIFDFVFANIKGIYIPRFDWTNLDYFLYGLLFTFLLIYFFNSYAKKLRNTTGKQLPNISISFLMLFLVPTIVIFLFNVKLEFIYPELKLSKNIYNYEGGVTIIPELIALAFSLSLYTSTFIAECVRAGILGIDKGQKGSCGIYRFNKKPNIKINCYPTSFKNNYTANYKSIFKS